MLSFLTIAAVLLTFMASCEGTGHVVVTITRFRNPGHKEEDGSCCDREFFRCVPCDTYFKLCVKDSPSGTTCNIGQSQTNVVKKQGRLSIRSDFDFEQFSGNVKLELQVWDKDRFTDDDFIEGFKKYITLPTVRPGPPSRNYYSKSLTLSGRRVTVELQLVVYCDKHFYGGSCSVKCIPQKDDSSGHYTCDNIGGKVCRSGWFGEDCTRHCVPHDDSDNGHYNCDKQGHKTCLRNWQGPSCKSCVKNWYGRRCSVYCIPKDSNEGGHYNCRPEDGKKECLPWWFGTECDVHCISHDDDENGHHDCAHDGSKTCKQGWYGKHCLRFCAPQNDDKHGHYTCDSEGNKVCLDGYRPPQCIDCLLGRYGANCSLSCNNATRQGYYDCKDDGTMLCKPWWYGPECLQYCVPHDDSTHGHYTCDPRDGSKVCNKGWKEPDCLHRK